MTKMKNYNAYGTLGYYFITRNSIIVLKLDHEPYWNSQALYTSITWFLSPIGKLQSLFSHELLNICRFIMDKKECTVVTNAVL